MSEPVGNCGEKLKECSFMVDKKEDKNVKKTWMECFKSDNYELKELQKGLDMAIGHDLKDIPGKFVYRGHQFEVTLLGKFSTDGSLA